MWITGLTPCVPPSFLPSLPRGVDFTTFTEGEGGQNKGTRLKATRAPSSVTDKFSHYAKWSIQRAPHHFLLSDIRRCHFNQSSQCTVRQTVSHQLLKRSERVVCFRRAEAARLRWMHLWYSNPCLPAWLCLCRSQEVPSLFVSFFFINPVYSTDWSILRQAGWEYKHGFFHFIYSARAVQTTSGSCLWVLCSHLWHTSSPSSLARCAVRLNKQPALCRLKCCFLV